MIDIITIDGPASSGKSTIGLRFAQKLGYQFIDSGAIYRAACIPVIEQKIPLDQNQKITEIVENSAIEFKMEQGIPTVFVKGENVTPSLDSPEVNNVVPIVAAIREVREIVKKIQMKLASNNNIVITGRDLGSEIFPNSCLKFYITAGPEVRARRRFEQLVKKGEVVTLNQILQEIKDRDYKDSTREVSPLKIPKNAVVIDNSRMNIEQTIEKILEQYNLCQKNEKSNIVSQD